MKKILLFIIVLGALMVSGCATPSQVLIDPNTGNAVRCAHSGGGWGLMGAIAISMTYASQQQCIDDAKRMGYTEIEKVVKVGDRILEKDGIPIKYVGDIVSLPRNKIGDRVVYVGDREGKTLRFELVAVSLLSLRTN